MSNMQRRCTASLQHRCVETCACDRRRAAPRFGWRPWRNPRRSRGATIVSGHVARKSTSSKRSACAVPPCNGQRPRPVRSLRAATKTAPHRMQWWTLSIPSGARHPRRHPASSPCMRVLVASPLNRTLEASCQHKSISVGATKCSVRKMEAWSGNWPPAAKGDCAMPT